MSVAAHRPPVPGEADSSAWRPPFETVTVYTRRAKLPWQARQKRVAGFVVAGVRLDRDGRPLARVVEPGGRVHEVGRLLVCGCPRDAATDWCEHAAIAQAYFAHLDGGAP